MGKLVLRCGNSKPRKNTCLINWLLWISCICWLIIVNEKGIGFVPDPTNIFIFLTLLASFALIGKIFHQLLRKDF